MALPTNVATCTVTGTYVTVDGSPGVGDVYLTPDPRWILDPTAAPPTTILGTYIVATLDATGSFSVELPASDDPDLNPTGFTWNVSERLVGVPRHDYSIHAPADTTVDLTAVTPVYSSPGNAVIVGPPGQSVELVEDPEGSGLYILVGGSPDMRGPPTPSQVHQFTLHSNTAPPPGTGQLRLNIADQVAVTIVYVDYHSSDDVDVHRLLLIQGTPGRTLFLQDRDNADAWHTYTLTAAAADDAGYIRLPVTHAGAGPTPIPTGQAVLAMIA